MATSAEPRQSETAGFRHAARALSIPNYALYTAGNAVLLIGNWSQRAAVLWLTWELTNSTVWLGVVSAADLLPAVALSPVAGLLTDRVDQLKLIWITQAIATAQAVLLALLGFVGSLDITMLAVLTLALGASNCVNHLARVTLVPDIVDKPNLPSAIAINALVFNLSRFAGPALAGAIIASAGSELAFLVSAAAYVGSIVLLSRMDRKAVDRTPPAKSAGSSLAEDLLGGYRYALRHKGTGSVLFVFGVVCCCVRGFVELLPSFADLEFQRGLEGYVWLASVLGLGAFVGGIFMVRRPGVTGLSSLVISHTCILALAIFGLCLSRSYWAAMASVFMCGFSMSVTAIGAQTLIQSAVDPELRGRVLGLYSMVFRGGPALNALVLGGLAAAIGLDLAVTLGGAACLTCGLAALRRKEAIEHALQEEIAEASSRTRAALVQA